MSIIDEYWPVENLEYIEKCPYCGSSRRQLAFDKVKDWVFNNARGEWTYWDCLSCRSLYLDPRPTEASIGQAYANYYTHTHARKSRLSLIKHRLKNEYISQVTKRNIEPRFKAFRYFESFKLLLGNHITLPFGLVELAEMTPGRYVDIGCGQGDTVHLAQLLGWTAMGIDIDPKAVHAARQLNLDVRSGTYETLATYEEKFDFIQCSHVIEHVHNPLGLLTTIKHAVGDSGLIAISCPNSLSPVRDFFGKYWRGLEAPRHIAIPSREVLRRLMSADGFEIIEKTDERRTSTEAASFSIKRHGSKVSLSDTRAGRKLNKSILSNEPDFINMICKRSKD